MTGSLTLVFETSTPRASLATITPDGTVEQREFTGDRSHNAVLFAPLQELLDAHGSHQTGLVLVGSGPGSYSGTRVGIAAAQGVAIAYGCPAIAVPSILAVPSVQHASSCLAIGDARRGSFWTAEVEGFCLLAEPELTDLEGLSARVSQALAKGNSVFSFEDPERFPLPSALRDQVRLEFPSAEQLWQAWRGTTQLNREQWAKQIPQPMYLRPPHITPAKRPLLVQS